MLSDDSHIYIGVFMCIHVNIIVIFFFLILISSYSRYTVNTTRFGGGAARRGMPIVYYTIHTLGILFGIWLSSVPVLMCVRRWPTQFLLAHGRVHFTLSQKKKDKIFIFGRAVYYRVRPFNNIRV